MLAFIHSANKNEYKQQKRVAAKVREVTYHLSPVNSGSSNFYTDVAECTNELLSFISPMLDKYVEGYLKNKTVQELAEKRSREEYQFELILLGVLWTNHRHKAEKSPLFVHKILHTLYLWRSRFPGFKNYIDKVRGVGATLFLYKREKQTDDLSLPETSNDLLQLLSWMQATGEYKQEYQRLLPWIQYIRNSDTDFELFRQDLLRATTIFEWLSVKFLRNYTQSVNSYVAEQASRYEWKENVLFCSRPVNEYHLNMVGAEIMNRALRESFQNTSDRVVLVPACMRLYDDQRCKAQKNGMDLVCSNCNTNCNVAKLLKQGEAENFSIRLIPHSSDFSAWLKQWEGNKTIGVVGVACVLNLLTGGYEMQSLGISSQCVFLEHTACRKHWRSKHTPGAINSGQLSDTILMKGTI